MNIKFRVWDVDSSEFADDMCLHIDGSLLCDHGATGHLGNFVIEQFTGLKDVNDKEIYEGDIVKFTLEHENDEWTEEIKFELFSWNYSLCDIGKTTIKEVVGNIHKLCYEKQNGYLFSENLY